MLISQNARFCSLEYVIDTEDEFFRLSRLDVPAEWRACVMNAKQPHDWVLSLLSDRGGCAGVLFKSGLVVYDHRTSVDFGISDNLARLGLTPLQEEAISKDIKLVAPFLKNRTRNMPIYRPYYETPESDAIHSVFGTLFDWHIPILFGRLTFEDASLPFDMKDFAKYIESRGRDAEIFGSLANAGPSKVCMIHTMTSGLVVEVIEEGVHLSHPYLLKANPTPQQAARLEAEIQYMAQYFKLRGKKSEFGTTSFSLAFDEIIKKYVDVFIPLWESKRDPTKSLYSGLQRILSRRSDA